MVKTYRYIWKPLLCVQEIRQPPMTFWAPPTAGEVSGGPYTIDVDIEEAEKANLDGYMAKRCWQFVEEVV